MKVLGIDTILHDVCVAVMEDGKILSNQIKHRIFPLAKSQLLNLTTAHIKDIGEVLEVALKDSKTSLEEISLIAVNNSGSFLSSVMIGLVTANIISKTYDIPIVDVDHQEGHIFSNWIERNPAEFRFPILVFSASGGHSLTALISKNNFKFERISEVKGIEKHSKSSPNFLGIGAFFSDLVCHLGLKDSKERVMGDGLFISKLAKKGKCDRFELALVKKERKEKGFLSKSFIADMAASFENAVAEVIVNYLCSMAKKFDVREIHLVGGLAANTVLRKKFKEKTKLLKIIGRYPLKKSYCTDNAVMIANLGYLKFRRSPKKYLKKRYLNVKSDLVLENLATRQFLELNRKLG